MHAYMPDHLVKWHTCAYNAAWIGMYALAQDMSDICSSCWRGGSVLEPITLLVDQQLEPLWQ